MRGEQAIDGGGGGVGRGPYTYAAALRRKTEERRQMTHSLLQYSGSRKTTLTRMTHSATKQMNTPMYEHPIMFITIMSQTDPNIIKLLTDTDLPKVEHDATFAVSQTTGSLIVDLITWLDATNRS